MVQVVGIVGFKGSGKDTSGDLLVREHGYEIESFANPLKDAVCAIFGWDRLLIEGNTVDSRTWRETPDEWWEKKLDWSNNPASLYGRFTPRVAMQFIGTNVLREHFDDNIWILSLQARLRDKDKVVVTDIRFPNEFKAIKELNGLVFRVRRGPEPEWYETARQANAGDTVLFKKMIESGIHISEWACLNEDFDAIIENDSSIANLETKVETLLLNHF